MHLAAWSPADTAILVVVLNAIILLAVIALAIFTVRAVRALQSHHGILSSLSTVRGLVIALEEGARKGGLPLEVRTAVYAAIEEQLEHANAEYLRMRHEEATPLRK